MDTKQFYKDRFWEKILSYPGYDLGQRELVAQKRFLPKVASHSPKELDVLHLASSTGREVPAIVSALPGIYDYLLNDIVQRMVECSCEELQKKFPSINFVPAIADIELPGNVAKLRRQLFRPTLIILVGNGVIFSNHQMDSNIHEAMGENDLFLLTVEEPHPAMFDPYLVPPVFELLSQSGREVNSENIKVWHDSQTATMHMACEGKNLLASYKPTADQLRQRMTNAGFTEISAERYANLHMLAGLYRRR